MALTPSQRSKKWRLSHPDAVKAYREERGKEILANYRARNPDKNRARNLVGMAQRRGAISKQPCKVCGDPVAEKHHPDYTNPLLVLWLCKQHHEEVHHKSC